MSATSLLNPKAESVRRGEALRVNIAAGEGTLGSYPELKIAD